GATWLTASTDGTNFSSGGNGTAGASPGVLTIRANPSGLAVGSYQASIQVTPANGDSYSFTIAVTFNVSAKTTVQAGPSVVLLSYQAASIAIPPPQNIALVESSGQSVPFTFNIPAQATSANCPLSNWLTASTDPAMTTPATLTVNANVTGMTKGVCSGGIN